MSVKIAVILRIKLANVARTEHEFLCFIDINKKVTYGIRRFHSMDIKSNRPDVFCKNIFFKDFTKFTKKKPVSESLFE